MSGRGILFAALATAAFLAQIGQNVAALIAFIAAIVALPLVALAPLGRNRRREVHVPDDIA